MMMAVCEQNRLHVLIFPFPGLSHILPACHLAKKLSSMHCFSITFLCPLNVIDPPTTHLLTRDPSIHLLPFPDAEKGFVVEGLLNSSSNKSHSSDESRRILFDMLIEFAQASLQLRPPFEKLLKNLMMQQPPVCCIISDQFLSWTQDVADSHSIPRYILDTSPAELVALIFYVRELRAQGRLPLSSSPSATLTIPGFEHAPPVPTRSLFSCLLDTDPPYLLKFFTQHFLRVHEAAGTLVNTFYELETEAVEATVTSRVLNPNKIGVWPVGPLLPSQLLLYSSSEIANAVKAEHDPVRDACLEWLDKQSASSVLYVSFGSIFKGTAEQIKEVSLGLEASKQPFLWVLHSPPAATTNESSDNSYSTEICSSEGLPEGFEQRVGGRGLVLTRWAPQQLILKHPSIGGFMTHCGWNSTLESITLGVPTIGVPQFGDQRTNCRLMVEQWRTGIESHMTGTKGLLERGEVERVVKLLMDSTEGIGMRKRAKELRDLAKKAVLIGGSSEGNLQAFVGHLHSTPAAFKQTEDQQLTDS